MKVQKAKSCLFCDEIYKCDEQFCPSCTEKKFVYLRNYYKPLSSQIIREVKDGKEILNPLSMVGKVKSADSDDFVVGCITHPDGSIVSLKIFPASQPSRFAPDYNPEPFTARIGEGNHQHRKPMERESSFIKGCRRIDAGFALLWDAVCRVFRDGTFLSRKEYYCGYSDSVLLPADLSKSAGSVE